MSKNIEPKLRFSEFKKSGSWSKDILGNLVETITPPKKLQTSEYLKQGNFPVIDQSQNYICGWTNDDSSLVKDPEPLIIFGDHTCALKLLNQPFAQGADGIKILKANKKVDPIFLFQNLQNKPVAMEEYKRHFSTLKEKLVPYPNIKTGEQQKIADCLSSLDDLITAQNEKVDILKNYKKGLLQQLFPQDGETVPRLRFPEFKKSGDWKETTLGNCLTEKPAYGANASAIPFSPKFPRYIRITDIDDFSNLKNDAPMSISDSEASTYLLEDGDFLIARSGNTVGKSLLFKSNMGKCAHAGYLLKFKFDSKMTTSNYFQFIAQSDYYWDWIKSNLRAGGQPNVNAQEYCSFKFALPPTKGEQNKIISILSSLNDLIFSEINKNESLKNHKKGLLQQMFPSMTEELND